MSIARLTEIQERFVDTQNCKGKLFNYNYRNTLGASSVINFAILTPSTRILKPDSWYTCIIENQIAQAAVLKVNMFWAEC